MSKVLPIIHRDHFLRDPLFTDCWNVLEKERPNALQDRKARTAAYLQSGSMNDTELTWKWNAKDTFKELFTGGPPKYEKSPLIDTYNGSYRLLLDVQHFEPEELDVGVTERTITISGKHEERLDEYGSVARNFSRKYVFPADVMMDKVECHLSSDGVLHVSAPRPSDQEIALRKSSFSPFISFEKTEQEEMEEAMKPIESQGTPPHLIQIQTLPDFDMVPFWARGVSTIPKSQKKTNENFFKVVVDMSQYDLEDMNVFVDDRQVVLQGKHGERIDRSGGGYMTREFIRKYKLPANVDPADVTCILKNDGLLVIMALRSENPVFKGEGPLRVPILLEGTQKNMDACSKLPIGA